MVMNCWETFYMQVLQRHNLSIDELKTNEPNPLYDLANITKHVTHTQNLYIPGQHDSKINIRLVNHYKNTLYISAT